MIEVAHIDVFNPDTQLVETLRVTSSEDFIANGYAYIPAIAEMLDFNASLYSKGTTQGELSVGIGTFVLNNADGKFDYLKRYGFDGRSISVYKPEDKNDAVTDATNLFFTGTMVYAQFTWTQVIIYVKSKLQTLNVPMQPTSFAGSNLGTGGAGGFEGSAALAGKTKPQIFGRCMSVEGMPVNEFYLMYGFNYDRSGNYRAVFNFYNVYVKGIRYVYSGNDYATPELLMAVNMLLLGAGFYSTCLAAGMIRLSSTPASNGAVVADLADDSEANCTASAVTARILAQNAGFTAGVDFDASELSSIDDYNTCPVGIAVKDSTKIADAVNQILDSVNAWISEDANGVFRFGVIDFPDNMVARGKPVVATLTSNDWGDEIESVAVEDEGQNIPAYSVELLHTRNWNPQDSGGLADAVSVAMREFFTNEYRSIRVSNSAVLTAHPLAPSLQFETLLNDQLYFALKNGDFAVNVTTAGNGWGLNQGTASVAASVVTITPNGVGVSRLTQDVAFPDVLIYGVIEIGFTVPKSSPTFLFNVTRNGGTITLLNENIASSASEDLYIVRQFVIPTNAVGSAYTITIKFETGGVSTQMKISNVFIRLARQGIAPSDEAARRLAIQSAYQERYTVPVSLNICQKNGIEIGKLVKLQDDKRFGLEDGKVFLVIGRDPTDDDYEVVLDLWRAE